MNCNHFAAAYKKINVNNIEGNDDIINIVSTVNNIKLISNIVLANLNLNNKNIKFQLDIGAFNIVPRKYMGNAKIEQSTRILRMWNGNEQSPEGECILILNNPAYDRTYKVRCVIVDNNLTPTWL